jgi:hypothetical protein
MSHQVMCSLRTILQNRGSRGNSSGKLTNAALTSSLFRMSALAFLVFPSISFFFPPAWLFSAPPRVAHLKTARTCTTIHVEQFLTSKRHGMLVTMLGMIEIAASKSTDHNMMKNVARVVAFGDAVCLAIVAYRFMNDVPTGLTELAYITIPPIEMALLLYNSKADSKKSSK